MFSIDRTDRSIIGQWWWTIDRWLLGALFSLALAGVVLIMAASPAVAERIHLSSFHFVFKHLLFLVPTLLGMITLSLMSPRQIWRIGLLLVIGSIIMLIGTLFFGTDIKGASRWIYILGVSLQPSEFAKPGFAIVSAWLIAKQYQEQKFPGMLVATALYIVILCLLLLQPDFGMSVVLSAIWGTQIFLAGLSFTLVAILLVMGVGGIFGAYMIFPHVQSRIDRFLDPSSGDNYQIQKSLDSFHHGGLFGTGPGEGQVKMFLPDAHADFIFAVAGEEFGLVLTLMLICLFGFIVIRAISKAWESKDMFCILAVTGISVQFGLQALIHMGSSLQLLPAKGMTLPFISYGGSSLLSLGMGMGAVLAMTRKDQTQPLFSQNVPEPLPTVNAARPFFSK